MWPLLVAVLMTASPQGEPGRADGPQERTLELRVIDARDRAPLPDVSVAVGTDELVRLAPLTTDHDGRCRIAIPRRAAQFVGIFARKEGFVPVRVAWRDREVAAGLPRSYTLAMRPGTPIGGTVRDTRGRPVAGALVYVWFERRPQANEREQPHLDDDYHLQTDAEGRWRCTMMPADLGAKDHLMVRLIHPDYVSEPIAYRRKPPIDELRGMTGVMVMEDGVPLTGRVVDSRGLPVAGARVVLLEPSYVVDPDLLTPEQAGCMRAKTDADGRFRFGHVRPGECAFSVDGPGYVRNDARAVAGEGSDPVEIRLTSEDEMAAAARAARLGMEQALAAEENAGPNDIRPEWIIRGVLIVGACIAAGLVLTSWRRRAGRRDRSGSRAKGSSPASLTPPT
jgi:protocatechuate 3,4-dioxygenase beta subunit